MADQAPPQLGNYLPQRSELQVPTWSTTNMDSNPTDDAIQGSKNAFYDSKVSYGSFQSSGSTADNSPV